MEDRTITVKTVRSVVSAHVAEQCFRIERSSSGTHAPSLSIIPSAVLAGYGAPAQKWGEQGGLEGEEEHRGKSVWVRAERSSDGWFVGAGYSEQSQRAGRRTR